MEVSDDQIIGDYIICFCYLIKNLVKINISKNNILNLYL